MMNVYDLVPKDKFDTSNIETLRTIEIEAAEPILEPLLEWMQDLNWPVAQELIEVLPRFYQGLTPHIEKVFQSNDPEWIYWTLLMMKGFPKEGIMLLKDDIFRLAKMCTAGRDEGAIIIAQYAQELIVQFDL